MINSNVRKSLVALLWAGACSSFLPSPSPALAMGQADHSKVDATAKKEGDNLTLQFKVVMPDDIKINMEGPWKLELSGVDDLNLSKTVFLKADVDESLPGFSVKTTVKARPMPKGGHVAHYKVTAFICTKVKSTCYRDVHEGDVRW